MQLCKIFFTRTKKVPWCISQKIYELPDLNIFLFWSVLKWEVCLPGLKFWKLEIDQKAFFRSYKGPNIDPKCKTSGQNVYFSVFSPRSLKNRFRKMINLLFSSCETILWSTHTVYKPTDLVIFQCIFAWRTWKCSKIRFSTKLRQNNR